MTVEDQRHGFSCHNMLLGRLSEDAIAAIRPCLSQVTLVKSQVLYENDCPIDHVYFMESGLVILVADTGDNAEVQVGMVGCEGFVGTVSMFDDDLTAIHRAVVRIPGVAFRMTQSKFQETLELLPELKLLCLKYTKASMLQISQIAACNARHSILQRMCRLILMIQDRIGNSKLTLTQEDIAFMLGVRRAGISVSISDLASSQAVHQTRGGLEITDGVKLTAEACSCYKLLKYRQSLIM